MSLGDYLRLLRAQRGGVTPWEIEAATPLSKGLYRQMEQRYKSVGDEEAIRILAAYFNVPEEQLRWRTKWPRKALSKALVWSARSGEPISLELWNGATVTGIVRWWDLGAAAVELPEGGLEVVQRHAVQRWDPPAPDDDVKA